MRCFWIPRPRLSAVAAAPARPIRRAVVGAATAAAPRALPGVARRAAGLMLVCVAGALPALDLLRHDTVPPPAAAAAPAAVTAGLPAPLSADARPPKPALWFTETGVAAPPSPLPRMPEAPVVSVPPLMVPTAAPLLAAPPGPRPDTPAPPDLPPDGAPGPGGGNPFEAPGVAAVPLPAGAAVLLGALGLALLLVPARGQTRPSA